MIPTPSSSFDLPDRDIRDLQQKINGASRAGRINFFVVRLPEGDAWSVIFQDGPRRATIRLRQRPSEGDIEDISTALRSWANYVEEGSAYTTEVPRAPGSEWS
jgi:hypothetical protein